jgi:hypothetical protein
VRARKTLNGQIRRSPPPPHHRTVIVALFNVLWTSALDTALKRREVRVLY